MDPERRLTIAIYTFGMLFFTLIVLVVVYTRPDDGQLYTLFAGAFSTFLGALIGYLQGSAALKKTATPPASPAVPAAPTTPETEPSPTASPAPEPHNG